MKRALLITLTLAGGMIAASAGAEPAAGPYAAVPIDRWPYVAVSELAADGYFTGYPADAFADGHPAWDAEILRREFASTSSLCPVNTCLRLPVQPSRTITGVQSERPPAQSTR